MTTQTIVISLLLYFVGLFVGHKSGYSKGQSDAFDFMNDKLKRLTNMLNEATESLKDPHTGDNKE